MSTHDTEQGGFDALTAWVVPFDEDAIRADYARRDSFMEDCTYEEFRGAWIEFRGTAAVPREPPERRHSR